MHLLCFVQNFVTIWVYNYLEVLSMNRYLKHEFRFNASHTNMTKDADVHSHTFVVFINTNYVDSDVDKKLVRITEDFLSQFYGQNLNSLDYFGGNYPSIEEMGDRFYESLNSLLGEIGVELYELGVSDNPQATYYVSSRIMLPNLNDNISGKNYDLLNKLLDRIG